MSRELDVISGHPANPMPRDAHLAKFRRNLAVSRDPLAADAAQQAIGRLEALEQEADFSSLLDLFCAP